MSVPRHSLLALSVAACFALQAPGAFANPTGPSVISGSAAFAASANALTVTNSANAIIHWQGFSIGAQEITRFLQPSAASAVLNRVVGAGGVIPQSVIDGMLSSNGRVFLLNPSGIIIGAGARIDVAGLVASSLAMSDADFLSGRLRFTEVPGAGSVLNHGTVETPAGGRVFLIGSTVENSGIIRTPQGEIVLAAGKSVELSNEASPYVTVRINASTEETRNLGSLLADAGRIGLHGAIVRHAGTAEANGAVVGANGEIRFVATKDLTLEAGSRVAANGPDGGSVLLQAETGINRVEGTVEALGTSGRGGEVQMLGERVGLLGTGSVDVSGAAGGGTILLGGDYKGGNPLIQNALRAAVGPSAVLRADATANGDGGRVIVWSDDGTAFYGSISARGGALGGNGGFVETSGKKSLIALGSVNTGAPLGKGGTWLLDPEYITIVAGDGADDASVIDDGQYLLGEPPSISLVGTNGINSAMANATNVVLEASQDITFSTDLSTISHSQSFTAQANNSIHLSSYTIATGGDITLTADADGTGGGAITSDGAFGTLQLSSTGGRIDLSGEGVRVGGLQAPGGVSVTTTIGDLATGGITTSGSEVVLASGEGLIFVTGSIDSRGVAGSASAPDGGTGGSIFISRTGETEPPSSSNSILITGDIRTGGGHGTTGSDGSAGYGGDGGHVYITKDPMSPWSLSAIVGDVTIGGSIVTSGGIGAAATNPSDPRVAGAGGAGGQGGDVYIASSTTLRTSTISANGGWGGQGGSFSVNDATGDSFTLSAQGGNGGNGGSVSMSAGLDIFSGHIDTHGGDGGAGGSVTLDGSITTSVTASAAGGSGGSGGSVYVVAGGQMLTGSVSTYGGSGREGGSALIRSDVGDGASAIAHAYGGDGSSGGSIYLSSSGPLQTGTLYATGGLGGFGGSATIDGSSASWANPSWLEVNASGGSAFESGYIQLQGSGISGSTIFASGGTGGSGGTATLTGSTTAGNTTVFVRADGGGGGNNSDNGYVDLSASSESGITFTGDIYVGGGNGAPGGTATATVSLESSPTVYVSAGGGEAGDGGYLNISQGASVSLRGVDARGGSGGAGGSASLAGSLGSSGAFVYADGQSGNDGGYLYVDIYNGTFAASGTLDVRGGNGGIGGSAAYSGTGGSPNIGASGGSGGYAGYVDMYASSIQTAAVTARGGDGASAGNVGPGGSGGDGNYIWLDTTWADAAGAVTTGNLDASGGNGAAGSTSTIADASGGSGGYGGSVDIYASGIQTGSISTGGGDGAPAGGRGSGGSGGWGSYIYLDATYGDTRGTASTGTLDASGGSGGAGAAATELSEAGSGGDGGGGSSITLYGSAIAVSGDAISIGGGGGKGGEGNGSYSGGSGGTGGDGADYSGGGWTIAMYADSSFTVTGRVDGSGGAGGAGGAYSGQGGGGGYAGDVYLNAPDSELQVSGGVYSRGGAGGAGGSGDGSGGSGGDGYNSITLYGAGTSPSVYVDGGAGGAAFGEGGGGSGGWAGSVSLYGFSNLGAISARGGLGATDVYGGASSGSNGSVYIYPYSGSLTQSGPIAADSVWIYPDVAGDVMLNNPANWVSRFDTGGSTISGNATFASTGVMDMTASVAATGSVSIQNLTTTPGSSLYAGVSSTGGSIVLVADNLDTSGGISTPGAFQWYSLNAQPIGVGAGFFSNVSATAVRLGDRTIGSDITLVGDIDLGSTTALSLLTSTGLITQTGGLTASALNAEGANVVLTSATNAVGLLQGRATGTDFSFANSTGLTLGTADATNLTPGVASAGYATLTALSGDIVNGVVGAPAVSGAIVQLTAPAGAIGTLATPMEIGAPVLEAASGTGMQLALNRYAPMLATANILRNTVSGDLGVHAWGGLVTTSLVSNPVGAVMLGTYSPLEVQAGILSATGITLSTAGAPSNDMTLNGPFTGGTGGLNLTIGESGTLLMGAAFSGTISSQTGGGGGTAAPASTTISDPAVNQALSTTTDALASSTEGTQEQEQPAIEPGGEPGIEEGSEDEDKKKQRKAAPVCR